MTQFLAAYTRFDKSSSQAKVVILCSDGPSALVRVRKKFLPNSPDLSIAAAECCALMEYIQKKRPFGRKISYESHNLTISDLSNVQIYMSSKLARQSVSYTWGGGEEASTATYMLQEYSKFFNVFADRAKYLPLEASEEIHRKVTNESNISLKMTNPGYHEKLNAKQWALKLRGSLFSIQPSACNDIVSKFDIMSGDTTCPYVPIVKDFLNPNMRAEFLGSRQLDALKKTYKNADSRVSLWSDWNSNRIYTCIREPKDDFRRIVRVNQRTSFSKRLTKLNEATTEQWLHEVGSEGMVRFRENWNQKDDIFNYVTDENRTYLINSGRI